MEQVLMVIQVIITLALIVMVLIQRSDSDGFGLGGGSGNNLLSGRGTANLMTRTTAILAALFMANALLLSILAAHGHKSSLVDRIEQQGEITPAVPAVPVEGESKAQKAVDEKTVEPRAADKAPDVPAADADTKTPAKPVKKPAAKKAAVDANEATPVDDTTNE